MWGNAGRMPVPCRPWQPASWCCRVRPRAPTRPHCRLGLKRCGQWLVISCRECALGTEARPRGAAARAASLAPVAATGAAALASRPPVALFEHMTSSGRPDGGLDAFSRIQASSQNPEGGVTGPKMRPNWHFKATKAAPAKLLPPQDRTSHQTFLGGEQGFGTACGARTRQPNLCGSLVRLAVLA